MSAENAEAFSVAISIGRSSRHRPTSEVRTKSMLSMKRSTAEYAMTTTAERYKYPMFLDT